MDTMILYYIWMYIYRENYNNKNMYMEENKLVSILNIMSPGEHAYLL